MCFKIYMEYLAKPFSSGCSGVQKSILVRELSKNSTNDDPGKWFTENSVSSYENNFKNFIGQITCLFELNLHEDELVIKEIKINHQLNKRANTKVRLLVEYLNGDRVHSFIMTADKVFSRSITWRQTLVLTNVTHHNRRSALLSIKMIENSSKFRKKVLGQLYYPLQEILPQMEYTIVKEIQPLYWNEGDNANPCKILVAVQYNMLFHSLFVTILKVLGLQKLRFDIRSNPYVQLTVSIGDQSHLPRNTTIVYRNTNAIYNETFCFNISENQLADTLIKLSVLDHDFRSPDFHIGTACIGTDSAAGCQHEGYALWHELMNNLTTGVTLYRWLDLSSPSELLSSRMLENNRLDLSSPSELLSSRMLENNRPKSRASSI